MLLIIPTGRPCAQGLGHLGFLLCVWKPDFGVGRVKGGGGMFQNISIRQTYGAELVCSSSHCSGTHLRRQPLRWETR